MSLPVVARRQRLALALGEAIRHRRTELGMSQTLLAAVIETRRDWVARAENGRHAISLDLLFRYAEGLGTTPSALLRLAEQLAADESSASLSL